MNDEECAAPDTSCGTPSGWRSGGRCWRCRIAHNAETNRYRGLTSSQRKSVLAALRAGASTEAAGEAVGKTARALEQQAARDMELRMALDGSPAPLQDLARKADFLHLLVRTGGDRVLAAYALQVDESEVESWRTGDPRYREVERAIYGWLGSTYGQFGRRFTPEILDRAAYLIETGGTITEAAEAAGTTAQYLRAAAAEHPRLAAALPLLSGKFGGSRSRLTPAIEKELRRLWADHSLSKRTIALRLHISQSTLSTWAQRLSLASRPGERNQRGNTQTEESQL